MEDGAKSGGPSDKKRLPKGGVKKGLAPTKQGHVGTFTHLHERGILERQEV